MNKSKLVIGIIAVIVVIALILVGVMAMNNSENSENVSSTNNQATNTATNNELAEENTADSNSNTTSEGGKILVAYFSLPETNDPNNMTDAEEDSTVIVNGKVLGNTQYVAQLIQEETGADIFRIEAKEDYPLDHDTLVDQALEEQENDARPEIKGTVENIEQYDTIFLGYPNWWGDMPMIIYTFLEQYNFDGKTIIPFNTHGGSGLSSTVRTITNKLSNSTVINNAFTLSRNNMESAAEEVSSWLKEIGITK